MLARTRPRNHAATGAPSRELEAVACVPERRASAQKGRGIRGKDQRDADRKSPAILPGLGIRAKFARGEEKHGDRPANSLRPAELRKTAIFRRDARTEGTTRPLPARHVLVRLARPPRAICRLPRQ